MKCTFLAKTNSGLSENMEKEISEQIEPKKQVEAAILVYDKEELKTKLVRSNRECCLILIKETTHQEDVTIVNIYTPNIGTPNFIKQTLLSKKKSTDRSQHNSSV
jgi:hypothetical protein